MDMGLTIFAKMEAGSTTIKLLHSIAHVTDGDLAFHGQDIAFMGDRLGRRFPTSYTLPKEAPWQWREYEFVENLLELKAHYDKDGSGRALWKPGINEGTKITKKLPKMLQLPLEWVEWLREQPHTPYELALEITRRIGLGTADAPSITAEDAELALSWCCASS